MRNLLIALVLQLAYLIPMSANAQLSQSAEWEIVAPDPFEICRIARDSDACRSAKLCQARAPQDQCRDALVAETFAVGQLSLRSAAARALDNVAARFASEDNELGRLIRQRENLLQQRRDQEQELLSILPQALGQSQKKGLEQGRALDDALTEIEHRIQTSFPDYLEFTDPPPISLATVQSLLGSDELLLTYVVTEDATFAWAISQSKAHWVRIPRSETEIERSVSRLRSTLDPRDPKPFNKDDARSLYVDLLSPFNEQIGVSKFIMIAPSGPLLSLPFNVLVGGSGPRDTSWFGIDHALTILPAPSSLRALRCARRKADGSCSPIKSGRGQRRPFVGYGEPTLRGGNATVRREDAPNTLSYRGGAISQEEIEGLQPLGGSELDNMARELDPENAASVVLKEEKDTETNLKEARLDDVAMLVFATHALTAEDALGEAGLVFTPPRLQKPPPERPNLEKDDGYLTTSEAAQLKLDADWVVLSGCNTAAGGDRGAISLSGLARAFLFAGARSVVVSQWPVKDSATASLMTHAVLALRNDARDRAEAMRLAMKQMLVSPDGKPNHPAIWGPFELVGEGRDVKLLRR